MPLDSPPPGSQIWSGSTLLTLEGRRFLTVFRRRKAVYHAFVLFLGDEEDAKLYSSSIALLEKGNATYHQVVS